MKTFKLVVDGIDLTDEDRKRIESGIEKVLLDALAGRMDGMELYPIVRGPGFPKLTHAMPNGGMLLRATLEHREVEQLMEKEFGPEAELLADVQRNRGLTDRFDVSRMDAIRAAGLANAKGIDQEGLRGPGVGGR